MTGILVHEWLAPMGGSEKVFENMAKVFPEADLLCLWDDGGGSRFTGRAIKETWLAHTPLRRSKVGALPLMPLAWRMVDGEYDWALVSSHLFAHHVAFKGSHQSIRKYVYVHTPARYIWTPELDARGSSLPIRLAAAVFKPLDRRRASEAFSLAANSEFVRERINSTWGLEARVIHPPVAVERIQSALSWRDRLNSAEDGLLEHLPSQFVLGASRFIAYKGLDRVIEIGEAAGLPVVIAGSGPLEGELVRRAAGASVPVHLVRSPSDAVLFALYESALAFVFPPVEDFGIMPVEAQAAGCPVLVNALGGARESTAHGSSGLAVDMTLPAQVLASELQRVVRFSREACRSNAQNFSEAAFADRLLTWVKPEGVVQAHAR